MTDDYLAKRQRIVTSCYEDGTIESSITDEAGRVVKTIINTQEDHVRQSLIKLGWTPPQEIL